MIYYLIKIKHNSRALADTDCLCYSVFEEHFVCETNQRTVWIEPRPLTLAGGKVVVCIAKIARTWINIDGYVKEIHGYVVPKLAYPIILGKS